MMSGTEIQEAILKLLSENGLEPVETNEKKATKIVMPYFKGKADMKIVSQVIAEMLV